MDTFDGQIVEKMPSVSNAGKRWIFPFTRYQQGVPPPDTILVRGGDPTQLAGRDPDYDDVVRRPILGTMASQ